MGFPPFIKACVKRPCMGHDIQPSARKTWEDVMCVDSEGAERSTVAGDFPLPSFW